MTYENLDNLKQEIEEYLNTGGFAIFYGMERSDIDRDLSISWDTESHPNFQEFLKVASTAEVKIIVAHYKTLPAGHITELIDQLDELELDRDERRNLARDLQRLKMYEGFISSIDLSFDCDTQTYMFSAKTTWYKQLLEMLDHFDLFSPGFDEEGGIDDEPIGGGYFSKN